MNILAGREYMGEFSIIKVFCINYLECMKMREKIIAVFYNNDYLKFYNSTLTFNF